MSRGAAVPVKALLSHIESFTDDLHLLQMHSFLEQV